MTFDDIKATANHLRSQIQDVGDDVKNLKDNAQTTARAGRVDGIDASEVIANIQLCYRHLEDAKMRLGKCVQALDGGVSIYDKTGAG